MKYVRVVVDHFGGPEVMRPVEDELPEPGRGEARVRILAADVSFSDVNIRRGRYPGGPKPPFTPGYAMVGVVDALGPLASSAQRPGVRSLAVGQRVAALTFYGSYSQYLCLPEAALVPVPDRADPAEAVSIVLSYVAAYQMLHRLAKVARGQRILVHGAAGGMGTAFLELAREAGVVVYGTASKAKHDLVERLGGTPIDYRTEDFVERVAALTGGAGVDAVFDPMGAAHLRRSASAVRNGGSVVAYGFYETANRGSNVLLDVVRQYASLALWSLPPRRLRTSFYDIRPTAKKHPDWLAADLAALFALLAAGRIAPVIAASLPLSDAVRAHQLIERAEVRGKLVLLPNGDRPQQR